MAITLFGGRDTADQGGLWVTDGTATGPHAAQGPMRASIDRAPRRTPIKSDARCIGMDHRPHIVVVEDEAAQRHLLVDYLAQQKFRVSGVDCGTALRKLVERELPALVLLDVGLP